MGLRPIGISNPIPLNEGCGMNIALVVAGDFSRKLEDALRAIGYTGPIETILDSSRTASKSDAIILYFFARTSADTCPIADPIFVVIKDQGGGLSYYIAGLTRTSTKTATLVLRFKVRNDPVRSDPETPVPHDDVDEWQKVLKELLDGLGASARPSLDRISSLLPQAPRSSPTPGPFPLIASE